MVSKANGTNRTSKSQLAKSQLPPPESRNPVLQIRSSTKDARFGFIPEEEGDEESGKITFYISMTCNSSNAVMGNRQWWDVPR